jgi:hypothetical protein
MIGNPHLTQVGEHDRCFRQSEPGQAAPAGWQAPAGKQCWQCHHFERRQKTNSKGRCGKHRELMRGKDGPQFPADTLACKHFEPIQAV